MRDPLPPTFEERLKDVIAAVIMALIVLGLVGFIGLVESARQKPKPEPVKPYRQMNWTMMT